MRATAFAPGHVSGLFAVHDGADDPLRKGSRGAGWSVAAGAIATVEPAASLRVTLEGRPADLPVTRAALERLAPGAGLHADLRLGLPVGQGFGMSASGSLAACLAAARVLGLEPEPALEATHAAEVAFGTGLGDAVGAWVGAGEVRTRPGCPPHGHVLRVEPPADARFLFCVMGSPLPTPSVLRDPAWRARTRRWGDAAADRIVAAGREGAWRAILEESHRFSMELGLMPQGMARLGAALPPEVAWGQCMLGNTLWATGPAAALEAARPLMEAAGRTFALGVDGHGARMVR